MQRKNALVALSAAVTLGMSVLAQNAGAAITVDGTLDSDYGSPLALGQNVVDTDSTASNGTSIDYAAGNELDASYATIENGAVYAFFAGNFEEGSRFDLFVQTGTGGQNTLTAETDGNQGNFNQLTGLKFDTGFSPNFYLSALNYNTGYPAGDTQPGDPQIYSDSVNLNTGLRGPSEGSNPGGVHFFDGSASQYFVTYNNSNTGGVTTTTTTGQAAVQTGVEIEIPFATLGVTSLSSVSLEGFFASGDNTSITNQVAGLPSGTADLGSPSTVDFSTIAGSQYVTYPAIVPEPASLSLLAVGGLAFVRRRSVR